MNVLRDQIQVSLTAPTPAHFSWEVPDIPEKDGPGVSFGTVRSTVQPVQSGRVPFPIDVSPKLLAPFGATVL
jgi:hypothetical protein